MAGKWLKCVHQLSAISLVCLKENRINKLKAYIYILLMLVSYLLKNLPLASFSFTSSVFDAVWCSLLVCASSCSEVDGKFPHKNWGKGQSCLCLVILWHPQRAKGQEQHLNFACLPSFCNQKVVYLLIGASSAKMIGDSANHFTYPPLREICSIELLEMGSFGASNKACVRWREKKTGWSASRKNCQGRSTC